MQFAQDLHRSGLLKGCRYDRQRRRLFSQPQDAATVTNFFTGAWLERSVLWRTQAAIRRQSPEVDILTNLQVVLPDGRDFELGILVGTPTLVVWLECKSGRNYPAYITRYGRVARRYMRLAPTHCALVLLTPLTADEKHSNALLAGMSVLNLPDLDPFLARLTHACA